MSDADTRSAATRGRASTRGGRGGFGRGGPRGSKRVNGTSITEPQAAEEDFEDQGEMGDMKRQYANELPLLKDMFPDWSDMDLLFALRECNGDLPATVDRITEGNISQFSEVKKNKDRARSRVKDEPVAVAGNDKSVGTVRGGRGRGGFEGTRGRGGRGGERGRGGTRGARGGHATTNGIAKDHDDASVPTTDAWATVTSEPAASFDTPAPQQASAPIEEPATTAPAKKTWASMFSLPPKPVGAPKSAVQAAPEPAAQLEAPHEPIPEITTPANILTEDTQPAILAAAIIDDAATTQEAQLPPPKNPLTQENVEHLPDESHPPATHTAASTVDSNDPRNLTPLPGQQAPIGRPALGGFAASAQRAASNNLRSASFQRRVQEQQEALVMPTHSAVDRAAVQFGSMGLNGEPGLNVDEEREDPETRQAPQHSPPSQPKASLPPSVRQTATAAPIADASTTKQAPGLPPASQNNQPAQQESALTQGLQQEQAQLGYSQNHFGGYGQAPQHDAQAAQSKQYDPFSSQAQQHYDRFGQQAQGQSQSQASHQGFGGLPSTQHDYSSYYNSEQQRNAYNQYYGNNTYGSQDRAQQDSLGQRNASGYGSGLNDANYGAQSQQSRYTEGTSSGNATPNPPLGSQQQQINHGSQQSAHTMHPQGQAQQQQQQQQQQPPSGYNASGFPYGHPYFDSPYAQAYQNQFGFSQYGGGYSGKSGNMYGAPQGYGQSPYQQHSSSPANSNAFTQNQSATRSATGASSGFGGSSLDEYSRTQGMTGSGGTGYLANDAFARASSGFSQGYNGQTSSAGMEDTLKPFADSKAGSSPALTQPGRPGSAANSATAIQSSQQQPQGQQSNFGAYQGYPSQNSQYGGLGGLGAHPSQSQQGQYGGYGGSGFSQYGSYNSRGGWGQYGGH